MNQARQDKFRINTLIAIILLLAGLLRFWGIHQLPFMHDEFSALFRTQYSTFSELIRQGVMLNDTHPAGVQVFLFYWVRLFGFNEFWIKLPFALMGLLSVWLVFDIARRLLNNSSALVVSALMAVMQVFVFYSQLARPYSAGLFFVLVMVRGWSRIIEKDRIARKIDWAVFATGLALSAYMHAFSMFLAVLVFASGFVFLEAPKRKSYLIAGLVAALLYSPHIPVFVEQIKAGTIGGWLGPPDLGFFAGFFGYAAHFSPLFIGVLLLLMVVSVVHWGKLKKLGIMRLMLLGWFLISLATAWLYSVYRSPVLQFSTLYFSFPFALMAITTMQDHMKRALIVGLLSLILLTGTYSLVFERDHYRTMYVQGYNGLAQQYTSDIESFGLFPLITMTSRQDIPAFYLPEKVVGAPVIHFARNDNPDDLRKVLDTMNSEKLAFAWTDYAPAEWAELARLYYPYVMGYECWFNAEYFLLSRTASDQQPPQTEWHEKIILARLKSFPEGSWYGPDESANHHDRFGWDVEAGRVYGPLFEKKADDLFRHSELILVSTISVVAIDTLSGLKVVIETKDPDNGSLVHWQAGHSAQTAIMPGDTLHLVTAVRLGRDVAFEKNHLIRSYFWNPTGMRFRLTAQEIYYRNINPELFNLFEPF